MTDMRVLSIGTDRALFEDGSASRIRHEAYAKQFGSLDIIVFTSGNKEPVRAGVLSVTPTNSVSRFLYGLDALRTARKLPKPDVVTVQDPFETGLTGWLIARRLNVPLHVQIHTDFLSPEFAKLSFLNRARVWIAGFVLRRASHIRVVSERIKKSIEERYHLNVSASVLPIFVDVKRIKETPDNDVPITAKKYSYTVLVVSRSGSEKNIQLATDAFEKVAPPDARLIVCGDIEEKDIIDQQSGRIFFVGYQDPTPFYKKADLVLVPSLYEGYGLVIIEALAAGKPVLSTDVGIAREAGAIVTTSEQFSATLAEWFKNGPRTGELKNYPYKDFDEYIRAYVRDIEECARG